MKYDGTGWCKQTAAIEEGRRCSCSFTHWCACRPGTKGSLMKVLTEAQGARGWSPTAEPTKPHHTIPCHTMPELFLPSLTPTPPTQTLCSLTSLALFVSRHRCRGPPPCSLIPKPPHRPDSHWSQAGPKRSPLSSWLHPSSLFRPPQTRSTALLGPEQSDGLKLPREQMTSGRDGGDETRDAAHQRRPVHVKKLPVPSYFLFLFLFCALRLPMCGGVCVCVEVTGFLIKSSEPVITETFTKL